MTEMLDGILLSDLGLEIIKDFDKATDEEKTQVIQMYLESLKKRNSLLQEEINSDSTLKQIQDTINFNTGLLTGAIKPIDENGNVVEYEVNETRGVVPKEVSSDNSI